MYSKRSPLRHRGLDLKLVRVERGISQRALARQLGVSPQRISAIEASYRPTTSVCRRYLDALHFVLRAAGDPPTAVGDSERAETRALAARPRPSTTRKGVS